MAYTTPKNGEMLYNPIYERLYTAFSEYFANPPMHKLKDVNGYSMYIAKVYAVLGIEFRYIVAFVKDDKKPIGSIDLLSNLKWVSLQTRTFSEEYSLPVHSYVARRYPGLEDNIHLVQSTPQQYVYKAEKFPLQIVLLPKSKKGESVLEYNSNGNIVTALETYQTLVSFS